MAFGKLLGEMEYKTTSFTVSPGSGKGRRIQINCEGIAGADLPGRGTALGTLTVEGEVNAPSGTWSWCGFSVRPEGDTITHDGEGTWERLAPGKLCFHGAVILSDGSTQGVEMVGELAARTLTCKVYDWS